jgi:hypothetical protein
MRLADIARIELGLSDIRAQKIGCNPSNDRRRNRTANFQALEIVRPRAVCQDEHRLPGYGVHACTCFAARERCAG